MSSTPKSVKWTRDHEGSWLLFAAGRGEVARVRMVSPNEYLLVTLTGLIAWHPTLATAQRAGAALWRRTERRYLSALHVQRSQLPLPPT
jgi:hypothetical protein